MALMDNYLPDWRSRRDRLNDALLARRSQKKVVPDSTSDMLTAALKPSPPSPSAENCCVRLPK
jgi:hypothetical protein